MRGDHYRVLVINAPKENMVKDNYQWMRENLSFLIDMEWKAIFDFDCAGHIFNFFENEGLIVKETTSDEFDDKSEFNLCHPDQLARLVDDIQHSEKQPSWIFVNGHGEDQSYQPLQWNSKRARGFKKAVQFFSSVFPDGRANVVLLLFSDDIGVLQKAANEFLTLFPDQWMSIIQEQEIGKKWIDKLMDLDLIESDDRIVVGMPWSHVNQTVSRLQMPKRRRVCEIPTSTGATVPLPYTIVNRLSDIEVLGCNECDGEYQRHDKHQMEELKRQEEQKFYRGEPPTWWNFWFRSQVCEREIHNKLRRKVEQALKNLSDHDFVDRVRIYHQPGAGGTTSAMHVLWSLRKDYRVGIVENCSNRLSSEQIQKLVFQIVDFYKYEEENQSKRRPVLLLLDNPDEETSDTLLSETGEKARSLHRPGDRNLVVCVFLVCSRLTQMSTRDWKFDRNYVLLKHELSPSEISWFTAKGQTLQDDFAHDSESVNPEDLISFNILKSNFSKEFMRNTVETLVKAIENAKERTLLKYISLLNSFDLQNRAVPLAAFDEMMFEYHRDPKKPKKVVFDRWENKLSDAFHVLVYQTSEAGTGYTRALCSKNALLGLDIVYSQLIGLQGYRRADDRRHRTISATVSAVS